jgi:hypothetical protein
VKHKTRCGGQFRFVNGKEYCLECSANLSVPHSGQNLYDYSVTNLTGKPIYVGSLSNLRTLEKKFGVSSPVANNYERNW